MHISLSFVYLASASLVAATKHHLFVGGFTYGNIYAVEFDDEALTLTMVNNITTEQEHPWITLSHDRTHIYAAANNSWASFEIKNTTDLVQDALVPFTGNCSSNRAIFITAGSQYAYANPFGDCLNAISISPDNGALSAVLQNYTYPSTSTGVHGVALHPDEKYLYAADDSGNTVWTHSVNDDGTITTISNISGPADGSDPRHLVVHPNGERLFVVLEGTNGVAEYSIDVNTHEPSYAGAWSLIPSGKDNSSYWSDEAQISSSGSYLWATTRARQASDAGYINVFALDASGAITEQLVQVETSTSGGVANSVLPAFFSDKYVALADTSIGFVEIWQLSNSTSEGYNASAVARVTLADGGCCANAVWVD